MCGIIGLFAHSPVNQALYDGLIMLQHRGQDAAGIMTCENDSGSTPEMSQTMAGEIKGSQVIIAPGLQHMGLTENPSFFITALVEFLEQLADNREPNNRGQV